MKFHDGTPFNAEAVKVNFDRMRDPKFPSARRSEIAPVVNVVAVDPATVQIALERPYSPLLYVLTDRAGMMVSPAAAQKEGLNFALHPVGTGARSRSSRSSPRTTSRCSATPATGTRRCPTSSGSSSA